MSGKQALGGREIVPIKLIAARVDIDGDKAVFIFRPKGRPDSADYRFLQNGPSNDGWVNSNRPAGRGGLPFQAI